MRPPFHFSVIDDPIVLSRHIVRFVIMRFHECQWVNDTIERIWVKQYVEDSFALHCNSRGVLIFRYNETFQLIRTTISFQCYQLSCIVLSRHIVISRFVIMRFDCIGKDMNVNKWMIPEKEYESSSILKIRSYECKENPLCNRDVLPPRWKFKVRMKGWM